MLRQLWPCLSCLSIAAGCFDPGASDDELGTTTEAVVAVTWVRSVGVVFTDNSLTKTGAPPWNAGAVSAQSILGSGFMEFTTAENTTGEGGRAQPRRHGPALFGHRL